MPCSTPQFSRSCRFACIHRGLQAARDHFLRCGHEFSLAARLTSRAGRKITPAQLRAITPYLGVSWGGHAMLNSILIMVSRIAAFAVDECSNIRATGRPQMSILVNSMHL